MTTLDCLIKEYGTPAFIKIDVEGYEFPVLQGLSSSVKALSFKFAPEFLDATQDCILHLDRLGDARLNYSLGESMDWALAEWMTAAEMIDHLQKFRSNYKIFGDIYVRFLKG